MYCTGQVQTDSNGYPACVGGEWLQDGLSQLIGSLFSTPTEAEIQAAFMAGFALPLICYLTSWAYQSLISFAERESNH